MWAVVAVRGVAINGRAPANPTQVVRPVFRCVPASGNSSFVTRQESGAVSLREAVSTNTTFCGNKSTTAVRVTVSAGGAAETLATEAYPLPAGSELPPPEQSVEEYSLYKAVMQHCVVRGGKGGGKGKGGRAKARWSSKR